MFSTAACIEIIILIDFADGDDVLVVDHVSRRRLELGDGGKRMPVELHKPEVGDVEIDQNICVKIDQALDSVFGHQLCHEEAIECPDAESALEYLRNFFGEELQTLGHERGDVIKFYALIIFAGDVIEFVTIVGSERLIVENMNGELFARVLENRSH